MKKIYNLLAAVMVLFAGANVAKADYWVVDFPQGNVLLDANVTEIVPGQDYVLESAYTADYDDFLCNGGKSTAVTDSCLFQFEENGLNADGDMTYLLKRSVDGYYVMAPDYVPEGASAVSFSSNKDFAFVFVAKLANFVDGEWDANGAPTADHKNECGASENKWSTCAPQGASSWVLRQDGVDSDVYLATYFKGNDATMWNYRDTNAWKICTVHKAVAWEMLQALLSDKFAAGFSETNYSAGTNPGDCDAELLAATAAAFAECEQLRNNESTDEAACQAAADKLNASYDALLKSVVMLKPGFYYMLNWRTNTRAAAYDGGTTALWTENYVVPEKPTIESAAYIWEFIQDGDVWYLKSYKTNRYMGVQTGLSQDMPMSEEPCAYNVLVNNAGLIEAGQVLAGYFNIVNPSNPKSWGLHTQVSNHAMVYWNPNTAGSCWKFQSVDAADLEALRVEVDKAALLEEYSNLLTEATTLYNGALSYKSDDATPDGNFDEAGLVIYDEGDEDAGVPANIISNAFETSEGAKCFMGALTDNDFSTYFHSLWSAAPNPPAYHYLQIDLGADYQTIVMKYAKRDNWNNDRARSCSPTTIDVLSADSPEGPWNEELTTTCKYQYPLTYTTCRGDEVTPEEIENSVGITGFSLEAPHRYIRIVVKDNLEHKLFAGYPAFYWSELRLFEGELDEENSILNVMDKEVVASFEAAVADAKAKLAAENVTKEDIAALQAAYDAFLENYPDPQAVRDLIAQAESLVAAATEGEGIGFYAEGSKAELQAAIDEVSPKVADVMTSEDVQSCKEILRAAIAKFNASLQAPAEGQLYYIKSGSSGPVGGHYVYASNSNLGVLYHGGYQVVEGTDSEFEIISDMDTRLNYMWTVVRNEDGSFSFRNFGTGLYMGAQPKNDAQVLQSDEAGHIVLRGTPELPGFFNFVMSDGVYLNAKPAGTKADDFTLVTWGSASGPDNSAFEFEEVEAVPYASYVNISDAVQVMTLPYTVMNFAGIGQIYQVAGIKENVIQLTPFEGANVEAGTPFVYVKNEDDVEETSDMLFLSDVTSVEDMVYATEPLTVNGLVGTLASVQIKEPGIGTLRAGSVIVTEGAATVAANSGYFTADIPAIESDGDAVIPVVGNLTNTAINSFEILNNAKNDVYTISGLKVRAGVSGAAATRNLPAGIYIVGSKKVVVK